MDRLARLVEANLYLFCIICKKYRSYVINLPNCNKYRSKQTALTSHLIDVTWPKLDMIILKIYFTKRAFFSKNFEKKIFWLQVMTDQKKS